MTHLHRLARASSLLAAVALSPSLSAGEVEVIFTEIPGHPSALVPGALDSGGSPVATDFIALEDMNVRHDGGQWVIKGRTAQGSTNDSILLLGAGLNGTMFMQDDQPVQGGVPGELYDFFDSGNPLVWDDNGNIALSFRAKGGVSAVKEKLEYFDGVTHLIVATESYPTSNLFDIPANPTGDELIGNSIGSVWLENNGTIGFTNTPIQNCSSFRYPAIFKNVAGSTAAAGFRQSGVSTIAGEVWDSFSLGGAGGTPDGLHWFAIGDTENGNTAIDEILVVDDVIVIQEGSPVAGSSIIADDTLACKMLSNGDWFARGDNLAGDDWAVRNGVLIAKTGDALNGSENYGNAIAAFTGNRVGDWIMVANTDNTDPLIDQVLVLNGEVISRENDPVDLDGNGLFDDNVFIRTYQPDDVYLLDDCTAYLLVTLQDQNLTSLGDAFLRLRPCGSTSTYGSGCAGSGGFVPAMDLTGCASPNGAVTFDLQGGLGGSTAVLVFGFGQASIPMAGGCTALVNPLPFVIVLPLGGSGPGNGSVGFQTVIPANTPPATFHMQAFVADNGVPQGFSNSNGVEVTIK